MRVTAKISHGDTTDECTAEFTDEEWAVLLKFEEFTGPIRNLPEAGISFRMSGRMGHPVDYDVTLPDEGVQARVLLGIRPFVLESEPTFFHAVTNIIARRFEHEKIRDLTKRWKAMFTGKVSRAAFALDVHSIPVNDDKMLTTWLNANVYHRDEDKRAVIERIKEALP